MGRETKQADRRLAIMAAATKVFDARGYAASTIDAVASEAGISHGSIYNYFGSKQELFIQVVNEMVASDESHMDELIAHGASAPSMLEACIDHWHDRLGDYRRIGGLILEAWTTAARSETESVMSENLRLMYSRWRQRLAAIIQCGLADGSLNTPLSPDVAASLIMGVQDGLTIHTIMDVGVDVDNRFCVAMKTWLKSALGARRDDRQ